MLTHLRDVLRSPHTSAAQPTRRQAPVAEDAPRDCRAAVAHWAADAVPEEIGRLRADACTFVTELGAPDALVQDVRLAVSEALTNVVVHAYPDGARGRLDAYASSEPNEGLVTFLVRDYGIGFRPRPDSPGMGAGLAIMAMLARTIEIARPAAGGTDVRLTFAVAPAGARVHGSVPPV